MFLNEDILEYEGHFPKADKPSLKAEKSSFIKKYRT